MLSVFINLAERGLVPDFLLRAGIRRLCEERLVSMQQSESIEAYVQKLLAHNSAAVETKAANEQHYEVPPDFFKRIMGRYLKYSSCFWDENTQSLDEAEKKALEITMQRAEIQDGMKILELGCGWGSLTLSMAEKFPNAKIVAVSNSAPQRKYILSQAEQRGFKNIEILTVDLANADSLGEGYNNFDRVVSVEMFEHFRNYEVLLKRISTWLKPSGKLFVHIFTHAQTPYFFETDGDDNWMGKYFFTGGQMPSHQLLGHFQKNLKLEKDWVWNGQHYQKTSEAWLVNCDKNKNEILEIFKNVYGHKESGLMFHRWRIFFLAVAELFGYQQGQQWAVSHYLFTVKS